LSQFGITTTHVCVCVCAGQRLTLKSQRVLKTTIPDKAALPSAVVGLALLDTLLYVVRKRSPYVFVFDTEDQRRVSLTPCCLFLMVEFMSSCIT